jgi:zinc protease
MPVIARYSDTNEFTTCRGSLMPEMPAGVQLVSEHPFGAEGLSARMYRMPNQLRVLLLRDPSAPVFAYQTWFRVGSRNEKEGKTGIAHLFEHLMFNETEHLAHGEFDRMIESQGGNTNAATWVDWTYYQDDLPKSELPMIVRLEADRMAHLVVKRHQVETERGVVMSERRLRVEDDVDGFLSEELYRLAFDKGHPYHWPTIGWMRDIKRLGLRDAVAFYRTYYAPNNATIVVVGDIDEAAALRLINEHYRKIPPQEIPPEPPLPETVQTAERRALFSKPVTTDKLLLAYKAPGFTDPDHIRLDFLNELLLGGHSSAIYRDLVIEREVCSSISGSLTPFRSPGLWELGAWLQRGHLAEEVLDSFEGHIDRVKREGVSQAEMERTRARLLTEFYGGMRTSHGKAAQLGEYETTAGDYRTLFAVPDALRAIKASDMQDIARRYLLPERRTVLIARPHSSGKRRGVVKESADA